MQIPGTGISDARDLCVRDLYFPVHVQQATQCCSAGIVEALRHHKLLAGTHGATQQQASATSANAGALSDGAAGAPALDSIQQPLREMAASLAQGRATQLLAREGLAGQCPDLAAAVSLDGYCLHLYIRPTVKGFQGSGTHCMSLGFCGRPAIQVVAVCP